MKYLRLFLLLIFWASLSNVYAQLSANQTFSRYDSLRGTLTPLRTCYDIFFYDLNLRIDPATKRIKGHNTIHYKTSAPFTRLQVDLFSNMKISRVVHQGDELQFERDSNFVFVTFPQEQKKDIVDAISIYYEGQPLVALNPPWHGGFSWEKDETGKDWVGISCEGIGASLWWPNKDHLSDEPDSMRMSYEVPSHLMCVANGNLRKKTPLNDGFTRYDWHVTYPINNYNVTLNIADYAHFSDVHTAQDGEKLTLNYYVLRYNLEKAKKHFTEVNPNVCSDGKNFCKYTVGGDGY